MDKITGIKLTTEILKKMERALHDSKFRQHLLSEAITEFLVGDLVAGKAMLRDYINATITF